ncbi:hypothetical protein EMCRGX_G006390 [Ephydatia muelleri]
MELDDAEGLPSKLRRELAIQRTNLLSVCRMCVKSLVDKAAIEPVCDEDANLQNFCTVMEHIMLHRYEGQWSFFGPNDTKDFWVIITRLAPPTSVGSVMDMETIQSNVGRGRAWLRLALVQKRLAHFIATLVAQREVLRQYYGQGAFMRSSELEELSETFKCLDSIDFILCLRGENFDRADLMPVNYSPYLCFRQSRESITEDTLEAQRLSGSKDNQSENEDTTPPPESSELVKTKELLRVEREQKSYFEKLVGIRDRRMEQLTEMITEKEKQNKDMEKIILELQEQSTKLGQALKEAQNKIQELTLTQQ